MNNTQTHEVTKEAVRAKFHGHDTLRGKTVPRFPDTAERELRRITTSIMRITNQELRKRLPEITREYQKAMRGDTREDGIGDFDKFLRRFFTEVSASIGDRLEALGLVKRLNDIAEMTKKNAIREWKRAVKTTLGIDILSDYYKGSFFMEYMQKWIADNVGKIKTIPSSTLDGMRQIIFDGYRNGRSIRSIQKEIQEEYGKNKRNSELLARDQVATLNSQITQAQQRDAGVTHYKWSTSRDSRVRECHEDFDGKIFSWDDPPEIWYNTKSKGRVFTGRRCHPGEDYCCRCVPIPVFDLETVDLPIGGTE